MDVRSTSPHPVSLPPGGNLSVDSGMVPDDDPRPRVCSPRSADTPLVLVSPSIDNNGSLPGVVAKRRTKDVNVTSYVNDHKWTMEDENTKPGHRDVKKFEEGAKQAKNGFQKEVHEWKEPAMEKENEGLPTDLQAYNFNDVNGDDLISNSST